MRVLRPLFILLWDTLSVLSSYSAAESIMSHANWRLLNDSECGSSSADRIVGGKNASMGAYPWIARIGYTGIPRTGVYEIVYRCGGSLINNYYVLTAAHCVTELPEGYKVAGIRLGEHDTQTNPDCENGYCGEPVQDFQPESIAFHKQYNNPRFKNDIAVIRLNRPVVFNEFVLPICTIRGSLLEKDFVGENAEVAGWGIEDIQLLKSSVILQTLTVPVVPIEICRQVFHREADISQEQLCVGGKKGEDSCAGDSGGPLMKVESPDDSPRYYLIGLVSFGRKFCGKSEKPAVYTKISAYVSWILENISP